MVEFTGERVIPGQVDADLWNEHLARYAFAARYAPGRRVLDAGCGAGYGTRELARTAAHAAGIDVSSEAVRYAREHYVAPNLDFLQASCIALPVRDAAVDFAVAFEVIEHLQDWRSLLAEIRRVLASSGLLFISTPNKAYYAEARRLTGPNPYHVHEFEFEEFSDELHRLFPHVHFFLQNHVAAIGFQPLDQAGSSDIDSYSAACLAEAADAHFYLAVCSRDPLPPASTFLYVPTTANVLREREIHIERLQVHVERLQAEVQELQAEKQKLTDMFRAQKEELDRSNAWAQELDRKFHTELEQKTQWALGLQAQLEAKGKELVECVRLLDTAEATVQERTEWARRLDSELKELQTQVSLIKASRWLKLGRTVGLGPVLPNQ